MTIRTKFETVLTVRSFAYVAKQLARSAQLEQIAGEAEKHRSALRLVQRDVLEQAEHELRKQVLTKAEFDRLRATVARTIEQGQQAIARIAAQYDPQRLAA